MVRSARFASIELTVPLVEVARLRKAFGAVLAVDDVSFAVERGEVLGFLGPNGAGKSTTMKVIAGVLAPTDGTAFVAGEDVRSHPIEAKRRIGYLPEGSPLYGDMTPDGFLDFVGRTRLMPRDRRRRAIGEVMERLGLDEVRHRRIETLSKGFRRRVGVAQAILHDPDVLILDEPTDGLDPNQKHEVRELIRSMGDTKAVIISTHILEEVDAVCDRAVIIDHGRVVLDATPAQLYARSPDYNAISLIVAGADVHRATAILGKLDGVAGAERLEEGPQGIRLVVRPTQGQFISDRVAAALRDNGIAAHELHGTTGRLDDVFRAITSSTSRVEAR